MKLVISVSKALRWARHLPRTSVKQSDCSSLLSHQQKLAKESENARETPSGHRPLINLFPAGALITQAVRSCLPVSKHRSHPYSSPQACLDVLCCPNQVSSGAPGCHTQSHT